MSPENAIQDRYDAYDKAFRQLEEENATLRASLTQARAEREEARAEIQLLNQLSKQ